MEFEAMRGFLSEENIALHKNYLKDLRLRYSVLEKSVPYLKGLSLEEIQRRVPRSSVKVEAIARLSEIKAHEIFFDSFSRKAARCLSLCAKYGSESAFLHEVYSAAKKTKSGFLYVYSKGGVQFEIKEDGGFFFKGELPVLAVDLFEHAYFKDYSFDRNRYLESAVYSLDLTKIGESSKKD